ncbi:AAA family ATPase [[Empedobacter] haloabium]|uniref:AAA family ATPase n=1 Tax=[Empedobacter] haloabium TaxID=592317 RepID=A0ABZ1USX5_9BURK
MLQVADTPWKLPARVLQRMGKELEHAREFHSLPAAQRRQQRFDFKSYREPAVVDHLLATFHRKCAYCESHLELTGPIDIELYRPKSSVLENTAHPGYWWTALERRNLLPACRACNIAKRNRFPLRSERSRVHAPDGDLSKESRLLLHPYSDDPGEHLLFDESGEVSGLTEEGTITIAVLDLNRPGLVAARKACAAHVSQIEQAIQQANDQIGLHPRIRMQLHDLGKALVQLAMPSHVYAGANRQFISRVLAKVDVPLPAVEWQWPAVPSASSAARRDAVRLRQHERTALQAEYSLKHQRNLERYRLQSRTIESISISNVRAITQLALPMTHGPDAGGSWMVLLGENGTAKTTVLRAVGAVLAGPDACLELMRNGLLVPSEFIRQRCKSGRVSVKLSGFTEPHTLTFTADSLRFTGAFGAEVTLSMTGSDVQAQGPVSTPPTVLLGYGATRLGARRQMDTQYDFDSPVRVTNLFDPFAPLADANSWLMSLDIRRFSDVALILQDLLCLPPAATLRRRDGVVSVDLHGAWIPLTQLSDGYQGMIALTADILRTAMVFWPSAANAEGIVLLDEIGVHLHPRWQMRVVGSLRRALPGMQFIVTTHEPLCLRGVGKGEVTTMGRDANGEIEATGDLPSPADYRVEQLLTSQFFGLRSTSDPETESLFDEYYTLLALTRPDRAQARRLAELKAELKGRAHFGGTAREQRMYELVDRELTRERQRGALRLPKTSTAARNTVTALWRDAIKQARGGS